MREAPRRPLFPNEHGAWVMFAVAFLTGWLATPPFSFRPLLLLPAACGAFLARYPLGLYFKKRRVCRALKIPLAREKKWFVIYATATLFVTLPLFFPLGWWWLLPFAAVAAAAWLYNLRTIVVRKERTLWAELSAMAGLSSLTPVASYAARLQTDFFPFVLWGAFLLFYTVRILSIRRKVARKKEHPINIRSLGKEETFYSILFVLFVVGVVRIVKIFF